MKIKTIASKWGDLSVFDLEVNEQLEKGWRVYELIATGDAGSMKYVAFLFKEEDSD